MPTIKKTHQVLQYPDEEKFVEQRVVIDTEEKWVSISHNNEELTMSQDNLPKLIDLLTEALEQSKNH